MLAHLDRTGFTGAPQVLAVDADTEVLSWIPGRAACAPLPDWALGDDVLVSVAALIRRFHLAMRSFDGSGLSWARPATGARWYPTTTCTPATSSSTAAWRSG